MRIGRVAWAAALAGTASVASAQQVTEVQVANAPAPDASTPDPSAGTMVSSDDTATADNPPPDEGDKAVDRGGLASRGGQAINTRSTFQEQIGTEIYTPIGTSIYTPVQQPPQNTDPQG